MENYFSENLKYLRSKKAIRQSDIALHVGKAPNTIGYWEAKKNEPDISDLIKVAQYFDISIADLLFMNLANVGIDDKIKSSEYVGMNVGIDVGIPPKKEADQKQYTTEMTHAEMMVMEAESTYSGRPNNVFDLKSKAAAGTVVQILEDGDKKGQKPNLYLPGLGSGIHIRIGIEGDSMHNTIKSGDKVVATLVTDVQNIRPGYVYAILDKSDGFVCKRLYWEEDELEFVSDNEIYKPYKRGLNDLFAIFKVREVHSKDLRPYFLDVRREMREIRSEMAAIRSLITK